MSRALYLSNLFAGNKGARPEAFVLAVAIPFGIYGIALFGFRIFDPLPAARRAAIEQMRSGMIVLDTRWQVLSLNAAAENVLGVPSRHARGKTLQELLPAYPDLHMRLTAMESGPAEISLGMEPEARHYALDLSRLRNHHGLITGYLILMNDVTEQRQAQAQILEHQWARAILQEREQLAQELHDGVSQSLSFLNLQAQTAQVYLRAGQGEAAESSLTRLVETSREMQDDVRELIGDLLDVSLPSEGFCSALRQVVARFEAHTGLTTILSIVDEAEMVCEPAHLSPPRGVQLLRIVQEALANVRKHAGAPDHVGIRLGVTTGWLNLTITDNGAGFDPRLLDPTGKHFGLQVMHQRAERIGGQLTIHSGPGEGTRVEIRIPLAGAGLRSTQ